MSNQTNDLVDLDDPNVIPKILEGAPFKEQKPLSGMPYPDPIASKEAEGLDTTDDLRDKITHHG